MPDRDEDKAFQQAEFSKGQREIGQQALEEHRGRSESTRSDSLNERPDRDASKLSVADQNADKGLEHDKGKEASWSKDGTDKGLSPQKQHELREDRIAALTADTFSAEKYKEMTNGEAKEWTMLRPQEKEQVFRDAEKLAAGLEGRTRCKIGTFEGEPFDGKFDPKTESMDFSRDSTLKHSDEKAAMRTLFHEQTHRQQWEAIKNPEAFPQFSASQVAEWKENFKPENYKPWGKDPEQQQAYLDQPIEKHARERAEKMLEKVDEYRKRNKD